jgi:hypothetical protein
LVVALSDASSVFPKVRRRSGEGGAHTATLDGESRRPRTYPYRVSKVIENG